MQPEQANAGKKVINEIQDEGLLIKVRETKVMK